MSERRKAGSPRQGARITKAERKRQLVSHAKLLFVSLGFQATTTEKIAAASGVSELILSRYFETKKAILLEILEEVRAVTINRWHAETAELADPLAKLHAIAEMYLGSTRDHAVELRIVHRMLVDCDDEEIVDHLRAFYLDAETLLARLLTEGQQSGVFRRSLDPRVGAWELIRTGLGFSLTLPLGPPIYGEPDYVPRAIECILHGLLKTDV
jgi:AcrR family transcriptional regulator